MPFSNNCTWVTSLKSVPAADLIFGHGVYTQHQSPHHKSEKQKIVSVKSVDKNAEKQIR